MKLALVIITTTIFISLMIDRIVTRSQRKIREEKEEVEYDDIDRAFFDKNLN